MTGDDPLDYEVVVSAKMDELGFSATAKSRGVAGFDRFVGNFFDLLNPPLEGFNRRQRLRNDIREKIIANAGGLALEDDELTQKIAKSIRLDVTTKEIRKVENKLAIAISAIDVLQEERPTGSEDDIDQTTENISEDWMNVFESHAENASSDDLQKMWARVLAKEIQRPGRFAIGTLRIVSELDTTIAKLFEKHVAARVSGDQIIHPERLEGQTLVELLALEDAGLITGALGTMKRQVHFDNHTNNTREGRFVLSMEVAQANKIIPLGITRLTRAGVDVTSILPPPDAKAALKVFFERIQSNLKSATLFVIVSEEGPNQVKMAPIEVLKAAAS